MADVHFSCGDSGDLKTGSPNCTISDGVLTFTVAQTGNIGVGDRITYDTSKFCFIKSKVSTTVWNVTTGTGANPTNEASEVTVNSIAHEYLTLVALEAGCTDSDHVNATNWTAAGADVNVYGECYKKSSPEALSIFFIGMTTDSTHEFIIQTPTNTSTECNTNQRNTVTGGIDTNYHLFRKTTGNFIEQRTAYMRFIGLQLEITSSSGNCLMMNWSSGLSLGETRVFDCILKADGNSSNLLRGMYVLSNVVDGHNFYIKNCIFYDFGDNGNTDAIILIDTGCNYYVSNCTFYDCENGIHTAGSSNCIAKNNVFLMQVGQWSYTGAGMDLTNSTNNATKSGQEFGANQITLSSVTATDYFTSATDFTVDSTATNVSEILLAGADLSADSNFPFNDDFQTDTRPAGRWDVGADQYSEALVNVVITPLLSRSLSAI